MTIVNQQIEILSKWSVKIILKTNKQKNPKEASPWYDVKTYNLSPIMRKQTETWDHGTWAPTGTLENCQGHEKQKLLQIRGD